MGHQMYKGKMVSVVRPAHSGDPGYDELVASRPQTRPVDQHTSRVGEPVQQSGQQDFADEYVLVKTEDGSEVTVRKSDITDDTTKP